MRDIHLPVDIFYHGVYQATLEPPTVNGIPTVLDPAQAVREAGGDIQLLRANGWSLFPQAKRVDL
jgi:hypothetical protein